MTTTTRMPGEPASSSTCSECRFVVAPPGSTVAADGRLLRSPREKSSSGRWPRRTRGKSRGRWAPPGLGAGSARRGGDRRGGEGGRWTRMRAERRRDRLRQGGGHRAETRRQGGRRRARTRTRTRTGGTPTATATGGRSRAGGGQSVTRRRPHARRRGGGTSVGFEVARSQGVEVDRQHRPQEQQLGQGRRQQSQGGKEVSPLRRRSARRSRLDGERRGSSGARGPRGSASATLGVRGRVLGLGLRALAELLGRMIVTGNPPLESNCVNFPSKVPHSRKYLPLP